VRWEVRNAGRAPEQAWKHISDLGFFGYFFLPRKKSNWELEGKALQSKGNEPLLTGIINLKTLPFQLHSVIHLFAFSTF
jgi:hypothetical protein